MSAYKNPNSLPFPQSIMSEIVQANFSRSEELFEQQAMEEMKQALLNPIPEKMMSRVFVGSWNVIETHGPPNFKFKRHRSLLVTLMDERGKCFVTKARYNHQFKRWFDFSRPHYEKCKVIAWAEKPEPYKP